MSKPIRVVIAEDLDVLREHFCELVAGEADMEVVGLATSGKLAVQLALEKAPDVILMDIEMEVKHAGIAAAQTVLEQSPQIRIVFLTMHEDDETVFNAFEIGAFDYVLKTSSSEEIVAAIRSAHQGISQIRPEIAYKVKNEFARIRKNQAILFDATLILSQLTPTESEILDLLMKEMKIGEIAKHRQVEMSTIKSQINVILKKFKKKRTKEVVALLRQLNVTPLLYKPRGAGER
ncbi:Oxygen regulatory protein NreC [Paenibacillus allorhizoplanae]|uniref:Oxygen regulatory protein NreC n=1 Tax=Paenibacillus allorhizoplanae TaxID=2905648 RepID=A0ABN8FVJ7_9BACL|nr:response regulator transcription factor [Paenibacillus allorhizoplanae]CAH1193207.1 Oxygen regulatory protein NreC [Paenibacillus allorhizoplanae]